MSFDPFYLVMFCAGIEAGIAISLMVIAYTERTD